MKISFFSLLAIVFITLKLTHVVAWSWLWVLSPLLASFLIFLLCLVILVLAKLAK